MVRIHEFNGLKYTTGSKWEIVVEKKLPDTLVKFYGNVGYNLDAVMKSYLYLPHITQLNDALESSDFLLDFRRLSKEDYEEYWKCLLPESHAIPFSYEEDKEINFRMLRPAIKIFLTWFGSISFTTEANICNSLMWSHYASDKGFAVLFDRQKLMQSIQDKNQLKHFLFPINYVRDLIPINPIDEAYGGIYGTVLYMLATKIKEWEYESEWRLTCYPHENRFEVPATMLHPEAPGMERKLFYPIDCITSVRLGENFFNTDNVDTDVFRADNTPGRFKLKKNDDCEFLRFLFNHFNDRLYIACQKNDEGKVERIFQHIWLEKEAEDTFIVSSVTQ